MGVFYLRSPYFFIHILPYSSSIHVSQIASASWPSRTQITCMRQSALHPGGSVLSKALSDRFPDAYSTGGDHSGHKWIVLTERCFFGPSQAISPEVSTCP